MHLHHKPDFDACAARIEAWWQRRVLDRPPVTIQVYDDAYPPETFLAETFPFHERRRPRTASHSLRRRVGGNLRRHPRPTPGGNLAPNRPPGTRPPIALMADNTRLP